jgi:ribosomal-protein-alanine N-acetyltransferase
LDDIFSTTAEFGYWLGDPFWGKGIATAAGSIVVPHVMESLHLHRLEAAVFEWNPASMRVLEKLGFAREGVLRRSAVKEGRVIDRMMYAFVDGPGRS